LRKRGAGLSKFKALDTLGVEMNFAMLIAHEALKELG
jgi:hypothetical protein